MTALPPAYVYCICGRDPCDGLDCGVYLPGQAPRKQPDPKSAADMAAIRATAWATRRAKYGDRGHR
jgi:hypothetical protein